MRELRRPQIVLDADKTKYKIMLESARMFALSGYSAVSVRDIASAADILPASIYTYYSGKQDILDNIMILCEKELHAYYGMLDGLTQGSETFLQVVRNMFVESMEVVNPFIYYALYIASTNQFLFESCRRVYFDTYLEKGQQMTRRQLELAVQRGLAEPFDTAAIASLIMNCVLNMLGITVGRLNGYYKKFDIIGWYSMTIEHIVQVVNTKSDPCAAKSS